MEDIIDEVFEKIDFVNRYASICSLYQNYDHGYTEKKENIKLIFSELNFPISYSSKDKLFYMDYNFDMINFRFIVPFKYGFIDCYQIFLE